MATQEGISMSELKSRPKSKILKSAGKMWEIARVLINAVFDMNGNDMDLQRLFYEDGVLAHQVAAAIVGRFNFSEIGSAMVKSPLEKAPTERNEKFLSGSLDDKTWEMMWRIMKVLRKAVFDMNGSDEDLQRLLKEDGVLVHLVAQTIIAGRPNIHDTFPVLINPSLSLADRIILCRLTEFDEDLTDKNFPLLRKEGAEAFIAKLSLVKMRCKPEGPGCEVFSDAEVLEELKSKDLEHARIEHMLAFSATFPNIQREMQVTACGSFCHAKHMKGEQCLYPTLLGNKKERSLNLILKFSSNHSPWGLEDYFLAVPKVA
jgi:hypothetical protein